MKTLALSVGVALLLLSFHGEAGEVPAVEGAEVSGEAVERAGEGATTSLPEPNYLRAGFWLAKSMAWATVWYLSADEVNTRDWDYSGLFSRDPELIPQLEKWRGLSGWRFDDNAMYLNTPLHPMAGAGYHILARSSHLGFWPSVLATNLTSLFWEAVVEHHEVMSLNDLITTGIGGIVLGEAYYQLGQFFRYSQQMTVNRALAWVFGAPLQFFDWRDGRTVGAEREVDENGWPLQTWNRFRVQSALSAAGSKSGVERYDGEVFARLELVHLPEFRRAGAQRGWQAGVLSNDLQASLAVGTAGIQHWQLQGHLDGAGYFHQHLRGAPDRLQGHSFFVGAGLGIRHVEHQYTDHNDRYGLVHLPGFRLDSTFFFGVGDVRLRYGVHPDFALIDSRGLDEYRQQTGREPARTVTEEFGYYYGWGLSSLLALEFDLRVVQMHWHWDHHRVRSIDKLDRFHDDTDRFGPNQDGYLAISDRISFHEFAAFVPLRWQNLRPGALAQYRRRVGTVADDIHGVTGESEEWRLLGVMQLRY